MSSGIHFTKIGSSAVSYCLAFDAFAGVTRTEMRTRQISPPFTIRLVKFGENDAIS